MTTLKYSSKFIDIQSDPKVAEHYHLCIFACFTCIKFYPNMCIQLRFTLLPNISCPSIVTSTAAVVASIGTVVGASVSVIFVVSCLGMLVASVLCYISKRSKESHEPSSNSDHVYEKCTISDPVYEMGIIKKTKGYAIGMDTDTAHSSLIPEMDAHESNIVEMNTNAAYGLHTVQMKTDTVYESNIIEMNTNAAYGSHTVQMNASTAYSSHNIEETMYI